MRFGSDAALDDPERRSRCLRSARRLSQRAIDPPSSVTSRASPSSGLIAEVHGRDAVRHADSDHHSVPLPRVGDCRLGESYLPRLDPTHVHSLPLRLCTVSPARGPRDGSAEWTGLAFSAMGLTEGWRAGFPACEVAVQDASFVLGARTALPAMPRTADPRFVRESGRRPVPPPRPGWPASPRRARGSRRLDRV